MIVKLYLDVTLGVDSTGLHCPSFSRTLQSPPRTNLPAQHGTRRGRKCDVGFGRPYAMWRHDNSVRALNCQKCRPWTDSTAEYHLGKDIMELLTGIFWERLGGRPYLPWRIKFRNLSCKVRLYKFFLSRAHRVRSPLLPLSSPT
jgi:hypothetical protein